MSVSSLATHHRPNIFMQALTFSAAGMRFALRLSDIVQVLPDCDCRPVPLMPVAIVGLVRFAAALIPVVDLGLMLSSAPAAMQRATRLIVVQINTHGTSIERRLFAVRAEAVLDLIEIAACAAGIAGAPHRWLGEHILAGAQSPQLIEVQHLLPVELHALYFSHQCVADELHAH